MLTSLTTSIIGRPSHGTYTSTGLLRGGMGCRRELGQWGLLKWGSTESRDRHDRITQAIYPRIQGRVGPRGDQHVQAEFEREVQELRAETAYLKNAALIRWRIGPVTLGRRRPSMRRTTLYSTTAPARPLRRKSRPWQDQGPAETAFWEQLPGEERRCPAKPLILALQYPDPFPGIPEPRGFLLPQTWPMAGLSYWNTSVVS